MENLIQAEEAIKEFRDKYKIDLMQAIVVSKAITDDALWEREGRGKGLDHLGDRRLRSEVINPLYQDIRTRITNTKAVRLEEARIAKTMELGEVRIVSPATEPASPIRPKKRLNVAISGILGLMLGVFIAFSQEFWAKGKDKE